VYAPSTKKLTPVMEQYRDAKAAFPDAILFFRLGDFYEMFNQDAVIAARELQLTLTSRNKGAPDQVPMAGVPYHAAHGYLARLIARGHKVAICEQLGDPSKLKGLVPRKVVRVVTPGLVTADDQLEAKRHNHLVALEVTVGGAGSGLAVLDVSTGELSAASLPSAALLLAEVARAEPAELLVPEGHDDLRRALGVAFPGTALRKDEGIDDLRAHLDGRVAAPLYDDACRDHGPLAVRAAARVLRFAMRNLPDTVLPVRRIARLDTALHMQLDETAQSHLELVRAVDGRREGSLLSAIDATVTACGGRLLRRQLLAPLTDVAAIRRRLDAVELMLGHARARTELRDALARTGDVERLVVRASLRESTPRDLVALLESLEALPDALAALRSVRGLDLTELGVDGDLEAALAARLTAALEREAPARLTDGGVIRAGYDADLDELRALRTSGGERVEALEARLREELGIGSLKIKYTRGFGWYVEVTRAHVAKIPSTFRRKQSLVNAERFTCDELDDLAERVLGAEERFSEREAELFDRLVADVAGRSEPLRALAGAIARWDVAAALAETAHRHGYHRPEVDDGPGLVLEDARHPVVERHVPPGTFVPNDTSLDLDGERMLLVTGPNMAGKSTLMRQVALITILAQMGSFVPARRARIGVVDRVLSRVGASDNLARGESTFMVEMRETATILRSATRRSLVILDEIGRGTSTYDGLAIAWAVAEHLHERVRCRAIFATHYHELTALGDATKGIGNWSVSAREHGSDVVFLHRLTRGAVNRSFGIAVARLAGLPDAVVARARELLATLEDEGTPTKGGPRGRRDEQRQLGLFEPNDAPARLVAETVSPSPHSASSELVAELRALDLDRMTPLEALQQLAAWRRRLDT
jgi:DNA mismatch repair protein MutS